MATFVPPMLPGVVVFTRSYAPDDIVRQIRDAADLGAGVRAEDPRRAARARAARSRPKRRTPPPAGMHWAKRWWHYRRIHRMFGFKFWAMVVGAAPLDPELEAFWGRLGFLVVQGYGLTETAPIVTLNHPFTRARGAVGKPIAGVEVQDRRRRRDPRARRERHDRLLQRAGGDARGVQGRLVPHRRHRRARRRRASCYIRGRKKEMIVTPEGLNVFPEDVERALNEQPGVRDSAVVGAPLPGSTAERVQAVVVARRRERISTTSSAQANARLQDHQKIRAAGGLAGGRAAAHRRHAEAEAARAAAVARRTVGRAAAASRRDRQAGGRDASRRSSRASRRAGRSTPATTIDELGSELARARRADDGARGSVPDHGRRGAVRRRDDGRAISKR